MTQPTCQQREEGHLTGSRSGENLWELAVAKLGPEDKVLINFMDPDKSAVLRELLALTEQKKALV